MIKQLLNEMENTNVKNIQNDFLRTWDEDDGVIRATLTLTKLLKEMYVSNISPRIYNSGIAISIFRDNSTRTRYSFASGADLLGLSVADLDENKSQMAHGETIMETTNMISFLTRAIGIRDDIYFGFGHKYMLDVAKSADIGYQEGVLAQRPSVINLQSDEDHPTQALSDLAHLDDYFGGLENLKGKKLVMSWAYSPSYGKPLSVAQGTIALMSRFGMDITLAYPEGFHLIPDIEQLAGKNSKKNGGSFKVVHDMKSAFVGADIVYPKSWASHAVMEKRTELLKKDDQKGLEVIKNEALAINGKHKDWTCSEELMKTTKNGRALYMHCLPADISGVNCKKGEVDKSVFNTYRKQTYLEAEFKPFVIAAMILLTQYKEKLPRLMESIIERKEKIYM
ncbi:knotted carbamoyltransferase YgeW [Candidatus Gottesmanbacteria bacterium]|nr:knotted carbamoyltransferase YgeW [Candidatus Gottesmanbacteria bacterium]